MAKKLLARQTTKLAIIGGPMLNLVALDWHLFRRLAVRDIEFIHWMKLSNLLSDYWY
jgi:hypothetical protein